MPDALEEVLRLVAEGRLTAAEAEPILDALAAAASALGAESIRPDARDSSGRILRIVVTEQGRRVLNLRVPLALGRFAAQRIPGLSDATAERVRRAIELGMTGTILESLDPAGDGVRIVIE